MVNDILLNDDNRILIKNGDFVIGNGESQNLEHLLLPPPGTFKDAELAGADLMGLANSRIVDPVKTEATILQQLKDDKWVNEQISTNGSVFNVDAER